ncbi:MAG: methyltransferase domain-containing protein [Butyrivibrio sp.]|nr:methyltransferase domain-containing protein [Butyrivibrio sp.]
MGQLKDIPFEEESLEIKDRVKKYWNNRAEGFYEMRCHEIESIKASRWQKEIMNNAPSGNIKDLNNKTENNDTKNIQPETLKILDIGCGAGFFEIILGKLGADITGIDLTENMVSKACEMIKHYGLNEKARALQMDAENLSFADESFDMIITRNLTWTLPHPIEAYGEWKRVLKKGGVLLNFDAEYAKGAHNLKQPENLAHRLISDELKDECHEIYHMLTISNLSRPDWDKEVLRKLGFTSIETDPGFGSRIYIEQDEFYIPDKMFMIKAIK